MKIEVYILYSVSANRYYIGYTKDLSNRIDLHVSGVFEKSFTSKYKDWEFFYSIECESIAQARRIEIHLKKMKSKKYLKNLKLYPEITEGLLEKYR
ncbi:GIY-YIG nuclease family protein [Marinifilum sp. D737]|uniref:GIY-YIG nuclease family protein n=1 Tax=Marinifilum sp. D737 TaxID=2969628 RepID=UPI002276E8F0|nr:GIY-YIG nuclease family protein [Marinifilum sp. D737]MCY1634565.1 GIY-YIG nuclease family protein [Marinifilum sp. D737]